jgi:DNA invertase Pin-like site-specific DNA recombinase
VDPSATGEPRRWGALRYSGSIPSPSRFEDRASGARADPPDLRKALEYAREGDVLIVWKQDQLGRGLPHLIETVTTLEKRGVGFRSLTEAIDTTTPGGPHLSPVQRVGSVRA